MSSSTKELRRLCREQMGNFFSDKGRLDEDGLIARVRALFLADPALVQMRAAEEAKRFYHDIRDTIREIVQASRVRAATIRQVVGSSLPAQMTLPGLSELATEIYTVPGEGDVRGDCLTRRQLLSVINAYTSEIEERTLKRARLLVVEASCALANLAEDEPISKLWGPENQAA